MPAAAPAHLVASCAAGDRRLLATLDGSPAQIPVVLGGCGSGRTTMLLALQQRLGERVCQYVDLERSATTPERFYEALVAASPFVAPATLGAPENPRRAFDLLLAFFATARNTDGGAAMFLLDEALELRTFESFPGLRHAVDELFTLMASSGNRFVLTCRYVSRASRLLRVVGKPFVRIEAAPLTPADIRALLDASAPAAAAECPPAAGTETEEAARVIHLLSGGHPGPATAIAEALAGLRPGGDPVSALAAALAPQGRLAERCLRSYELRLHRARGYGALKAILDVLSAAEPLNLTEIAQRLRRTPGSTKDYLTWLEDVDLIVAERKQYRFRDPLLRLWVRLYCHPAPPSDETVAREVRQFALERLADASLDTLAEPVSRMAAAGGSPEGPPGRPGEPDGTL